MNLIEQTLISLLGIYPFISSPMLVKDFLTSGADVTSKDIKGNTAVHYAAKSGSADALESLSGFKEWFRINFQNTCYTCHD